MGPRIVVCMYVIHPCIASFQTKQESDHSREEELDTRSTPADGIATHRHHKENRRWIFRLLQMMMTQLYIYMGLTLSLLLLRAYCL